MQLSLLHVCCCGPDRHGDIDRLLHGSAASDRMRAVSRCQRTQEAEHRLVSYRPYCNHRRIQRVSAETEVTSFLAANMSDIYCIDVKTLKKQKKR